MLFINIFIFLNEILVLNFFRVESQLENPNKEKVCPAATLQHSKFEKCGEVRSQLENPGEVRSQLECRSLYVFQCFIEYLKIFQNKKDIQAILF